MNLPFIRSLRLDGFLSFAPGTEAVELGPLTVLIGPNGSGKSNFLEAPALLRALPSSPHFQSYFRTNGGVSEWIWKGVPRGRSDIEVELQKSTGQRFRYMLAFSQAPNSPTPLILEESFEELATEYAPAMTYFRVNGAKVDVATKVIGPSGPEPYTAGTTSRQYFQSDASILSQRSSADSYPDTHWLGQQLTRIAEFREWTFGRTAEARHPQRVDLPTDGLLDDGSNLALLVQELDHQGRLGLLIERLQKFLPRFKRLSTRLSGGTILLYLHEDGFNNPIPATRLSDGTLRFIALLVTLSAPSPPPLVCIEEPELGLHPDALALVAEMLVEASERTQVIVTTHSDALVSALTEHVESILVCENQGGTQLRRLEAGRLKHWLDTYRLGDLWRMGEFGGNP